MQYPPAVPITYNILFYPQMFKNSSLLLLLAVRPYIDDIKYVYILPKPSFSEHSRKKYLLFLFTQDCGQHTTEIPENADIILMKYS